MSPIGVPTENAGATSAAALPRLLGNPWFDRTIAAIACAPFAWFGYQRYRQGGLNFPLIVLWIELGLLIVPMLARRPPKRVSLNPWYWILTYLETYWLIMPILGPGRSIIPNRATDALALFSLALVLWARISLGRNIGLIPAQRQLVDTGAYRYMRHPIYTSLFVVFFSTALRLYSPRNVVLIAIGMFWFVLKSIVEERFLREDPQYATYMQRVRARWIPFVV